MGENQSETVGEIYQMKVIKNLGRRHDVEPIEWTPYNGETVTVKTVIRGGKKFRKLHITKTVSKQCHGAMHTA